MDTQHAFTKGAPPSAQPVLALLVPNCSHGTWTIGLLAILVLLVLNYTRTWWKYHHVKRFKDEDGALGSPAERPPIYPSFVPYLGSFVSFAWDNASFIRRATTYQGRPTASRISIFPGVQIYLFRDPDTIREIFKQSELGSPVPVYSFALNRFFGMPKRVVKVYQADNSGRSIKPHPHTSVDPDARPFYVTHKGLVQGLTGPGLGPISRRYIDGFARDVLSYDGDNPLSPVPRLQTPGEWVQLPDLFHFAQHTAGRAMIAAHFGPTLLRLHPTYVDDLWAVDAGIPWFARMIPRFIKPEPYRARDRMIENLMDWYSYAREHFDESAMDEDEDGDPVWGSSLNRYRQKTLYGVKEHDDRAVASLDVGHSWGSSSNVVATIFLAIYHVYTSPDLLSRLRTSVAKTVGATRLHGSPSPDKPGRVSDLLDPKVLLADHLLCAIYAETLRLHGMAHFLVSAPAWTDVPLGNRWLLPSGCIGVLSSGISHADDRFWNTRAGRHPVGEFWPDRFLVDPRDPESGPVNPALREVHYTRPAAADEGDEKGRKSEGDVDEPFFTLEGTDGHWFPYGGGSGMCGGRFLAKNAILATLAYLVLEFDIEPQVDEIIVNPWRYGLGVNQPKYATPFRMRRRL